MCAIQSGFAGVRRELVLELVEETLTSVISHVEEWFLVVLFEVGGCCIVFGIV